MLKLETGQARAGFELVGREAVSLCRVPGTLAGSFTLMKKRPSVVRCAGFCVSVGFHENVRHYS